MFCLLKPPQPSTRTHLSFSSCDPGSPTLSGRSRRLRYRPECDNSFSCKAVIFLCLEVGLVCWVCFGFFSKGEGCLWVGFLPSLPLPEVAAEDRASQHAGRGCGHSGRAGATAQLPPPPPPPPHRYTPSRRAPHFLHRSLAPRRCPPRKPPAAISEKSPGLQ